MTDALDPRYQLEARLVELLHADATLNGLLFRDRPPVSEHDTRIYRETTTLPEDLREVLPRVLVGAREDAFDAEQDYSAAPLAGVSVSIHALAESGQQKLTEAISSRIRVIVGSNRLSTSNIIASELVPVGVPRPVQEHGFQDAWRLTREYRADLVGVSNA